MKRLKKPERLERLLNYNQVADILNVSVSRVRHLGAARAFPIIKAGKSARVRPSDLAAYIESNRICGVREAADLAATRIMGV